MEQYTLPIKVGDIFAVSKDFGLNKVKIYGTRYDNDSNFPCKIYQIGHALLKDEETYGFYKVTNISNIKPDECNFEEDLDVDLEYVAPYDWHDHINPEKFFIDLMKLGFTVISKDTPQWRTYYDQENKYIKYKLKQEIGWLAISPERGCIISTIEYNKKFDGCIFTFIHPTEETKQIIQRISHPIFQSKHELSVCRVGPTILDVLKDIKIKENIPAVAHYDKPIFSFPFTYYIRDGYGKGMYENGQAGYKIMEKDYAAANRKEFLKLPEKIRDFLWKYTDVNRFF